MKIIVLHDRYSNEPIIIKVDAIIAIKKVIERVENNKEEYSIVNVSQIFFDVKEHIDVVLSKIKNAEKKAEREPQESKDNKCPCYDCKHFEKEGWSHCKIHEWALGDSKCSDYEE